MTSDKSLAIHGGTAALAGLPPFPSWPQAGEGDEQALLEVLHSGNWGSTHGTVVSTFESEFAAFQQAKHGTALSNGTLALAAALKAGGVGIGDEVIVPPYTFIATAAAALFVGAVPVFADVNPETHLLDPAAADAAITERTKAIIPVHLAGLVADMDAFVELGRRHNVIIIEDAAQAAGAAYKGRPVGAIGDLGTFSFQTSKNVSAGEGGLVTTDDDALASAVYSLVNVGRVRDGGWYEHARVGYNLRVTEFQGALLRGQLARLPELQKVRETNAQLLSDLLKDVDGVQVAPELPEVTAHGRHLFMMRIAALAADGRRAAALEALKAEGVVGASGGYVPLHRNEALIAESTAIAERLSQPYPSFDCPNADAVSADTVWLPQHVLLGSTEQIHGTAAAITKVVAAADQLTAS